MPFHVRAYQPSDREAYARVRSLVYRAGKAIEPTENLVRDDQQHFVIEVDGSIEGIATALKMSCSKGEHILNLAGVASVGVVPHQRRSGVGSQLMRGILPLMRNDGYAIASLYAFRETYYRRFGYEVAGSRILIKCPTHRLPNVTTTLETRLISVNEIHQLEPVLQNMGKRYAGYNVRRTPDQWWRTYGGDTPMAIFAAGDPVESYAIIRLRDDFWGEVDVREIGWKSEEGYKALLTIFKQVSMNHNGIEWTEPSDSPFLYNFQDQGIEQKIYRSIMYRVLDVQKCLECLPSSQGVMGVEDPEIPENSGNWDLSTKIRTEKPAEITLNIRQFTQAFLGQPSLASIAAYLGHEVSPELLKSFPAQPTYCTDYF
jgi:predicted acetyltransferase